jgi:hypothetical protein
MGPPMRELPPLERGQTPMTDADCAREITTSKNRTFPVDLQLMPQRRAQLSTLQPR